MVGGGEDNRLYYCPKDGKVYHPKGNEFNQLQPEWKEKDRISSKAKIAMHVMLCDPEIAPSLIEDYLESIEASPTEKQQLKRYAMAGCLLKL